MWTHLRRKYRKEQFEREVIWGMEAHGIQPGRMFGLEGIDHIRQPMYPEVQIVVLSPSHGNAVVSRSPPTKSPGMKEIAVYTNISTTAFCKIDRHKSVAIASACQKLYKTFLFKKQEITVISGHGYQTNPNEI